MGRSITAPAACRSLSLPILLLFLLLLAGAHYCLLAWHTQPLITSLITAAAAPISLMLIAAGAMVAMRSSSISNGRKGAWCTQQLRRRTGSRQHDEDDADADEQQLEMSAMLGSATEQGLGDSPLPVTPHSRCSSLKAWFTFARSHWRSLLAATLLLAVVYAGAAYTLLSHRALWCSYPRSIHAELCSTLFQVSTVLTAAGVKHWMARGDLIALQRDGDIMPWEHDADVCILRQHYTHARRVLEAYSASAGANFSVRALSDLGGRNAANRVLYVPLRSLELSRPADSYGLISEKNIYALRDGEPLVIDLFPCRDQPPIRAERADMRDPFTGEDESAWQAGSFDTQIKPYCIAGYALPFPEEAAMRRMLDVSYPGWQQVRFEHHAWMCALHVDKQE